MVSRNYFAEPPSGSRGSGLTVSPFCRCENRGSDLGATVPPERMWQLGRTRALWSRSLPLGVEHPNDLNKINNHPALALDPQPRQASSNLIPKFTDKQGEAPGQDATSRLTFSPGFLNFVMQQLEAGKGFFCALCPPAPQIHPRTPGTHTGLFLPGPVSPTCSST